MFLENRIKTIQYRPRNGGTSRDTDYTYLASPVPIPGMDAAPTTSLISGITQTGVSFSYGYDTTTANIVSETRTGGSYAGTVTYVYDKLGQLKRVNDLTDPRGGENGTTWVYTYDLGGNITSLVMYPYTTGEPSGAGQAISYDYSTSWKDLLTRYNGQNITYDDIGNPLTDGTWFYTWEAGRQLKQMADSEENPTTIITYDYDRNGLRVRKTVNGVETNYTLNGTQITHLTKGTDWMHFYYGAGEKPVLVNYNGTMYTYVYSLQGDVVALLDAGGNVVVEYKYDAWGNIVASTGSLISTLGYLNPFRYRGYVYDEETGLYYLRSRYYKAGWGRFINSDNRLKTSKGPGSNLNSFTYSSNDTINRIDLYGYDDVEVYVLYYHSDTEKCHESLRDAAMYSPYYDWEDERHVHKYDIYSADDFVNTWNNLPEVMGDVYLYVHGGPGYIQMGNDTIQLTDTNDNGRVFSNLDPKTVTRILCVLSCSAAEDSENGNLAVAFCKLTQSRCTIGSDVKVAFGFENIIGRMLYGNLWKARFDFDFWFQGHWHVLEYCDGEVLETKEIVGPFLNIK